jgi:hypothetical protein
VTTLPTIQELVVRLANIFGIDLAALNLHYDNDTKELTYDLSFTHDLGTFSDTLRFGFNFEPIADFSVNANAEFNAQIDVDLTVGVDLGDLFGGAALAESFFVRDTSVSANATIDATNINAIARLGFLDVNVVHGTLTRPRRLISALPSKIRTAPRWSRGHRWWQDHDQRLIDNVTSPEFAGHADLRRRLYCSVTARRIFGR